MTFAQKKFSSGISLIEIVLAVAIISIIAAVVVISLSGFRIDQQMDNTQAEILTLFNEAKARTIASVDSSSFGVHIESSRVVLFKGDAFTEPSSDNKEVNIDSRLELANISLSGGGNDVVYSRLTGDVTAFGSFDLRVVSDITNTRAFSITKTGIIGTD